MSAIPSIIVSHDNNRGIGKNNKLPWNIPQDLKNFKKITTPHPIIMGRKTFESIGHILPNRPNIILTHKKDFSYPEIKIANSLDQAIKIANQLDNSQFFIIGGEQIYKQSMPLVSKLFITYVEGDFQCDTFFPPYKQNFKITNQRTESNEYKYHFLELTRI